MRAKKRFSVLPAVVLGCASVLVYLALIQPWALRRDQPPVVQGEVAAEDLRAPRDFQYVSDVRTEQARQDAERGVEPIYALPDAGVGRAQVELLNGVLSAISIIRSDEAAIDARKTRLAAIAEVAFQPSSIDLLLLLSPTRWEIVQREARNVLEGVMQEPIRSDDLERIRQGLPLMVSVELTETESDLVVELVSPLLAPNSFYSPELTEAARLAARQAVEPVTQSYIRGQMIVSRGQIITPAHYEALAECGLVQPSQADREPIGAGVLVLLSGGFTALYFWRRRSPVLGDLRGLLLLAILFVVFLAGARIILPNRAVVPYLYPVPAFALLVSAIFGLESGMVFGLWISLLAVYGMPDDLWLLPYYVLTSLCGVLALGQARRVGHFFYAAIAIAGAGGAIVLAYRLPFTDLDWVGAITLIGAAAFNGTASASVALPLQYLLSQFLGLTTALQLLEISRPDSPLLKYFLQRAPGTYQHSLQVANLAEQAAESIQADGLLVRVAALFHDVGKAANPLFFVENQPPNRIDAHDNMDPLEAAAAIIRHVEDGLKLARKYRLPRRILDFVAEHHGTLAASYQYNRAVEAAGGDASKVEVEKFRYPGPSPRSRESAILMLADGVEARARAQRPQNDEQMRAIVRVVIERVQMDGQLDHAPLTQKDLRAITESFVTTLRVTYHPRLEYPSEEAPAVAAPGVSGQRKTK